MDRAHDDMDTEYPLPVSDQFLPEPSTVSPDFVPVALDSLQPLKQPSTFPSPEQAYPNYSGALEVSGIGQEFNSKVDSWAFPGYDNDYNDDVLGIAGLNLNEYSSADSNYSTPEPPLTVWSGSEVSHTVASDQRSYTGSDQGHPLDQPEDTHPSYSPEDNIGPVRPQDTSEEFGSFQTGKAPETLLEPNSAQSLLPRPLREHDTLDVNGIQSQTHGSGEPSTGQSGEVTLKNQGGRKHGSHLSEKAAKEAQETRRYGACWPCHRGKDRCSSDDSTPGRFPCERCKRKMETGAFRNLPPICVTNLRHLGDRLIPSNLSKQLPLRGVRRFLYNSVAGVGKALFDLPLSIGIGKDIVLQGREIILKGNELRHSLQLYTGDDPGMAQIASAETLPIHVEWIDTDKAKEKLNQWLQDTISTELLYYPKFCFPHESCGWVAGVLGVICQYYKDSTARQGASRPARSSRSKDDNTLTRAFEMVILTSLMGSGIFIPEHAVESAVHHLKIYKRRNGRFPGGVLEAPRMANKVTKGMAYHLLVELRDVVLGGLNKLLWRQKEDQYGCALSVFILHLIIVGQIQNSLVDQYLLYPTKLNRKDLVRDLKELEKTFVDFPISIFQYKKYNPFQPFSKPLGMDYATERLVNCLKGIINIYDDPFEHQNLEVDEIPHERFVVINPPRLLSKFMAPLFEAPTPPRFEAPTPPRRESKRRKV